MGKYLVPLTMLAGMAGFAVAALAIGFVPDHPTWWRAAINLAVLGGLSPMIYAVNIRVVPVFSRRSWSSLPLLRAQVILLLLGAWVTFAGRTESRDALITAGSTLASASGLLFFVNIARLFRQPTTTPAPPTPFPNQIAIDKIAVKFTRWSGIYFLTGLIVAAATSIWEPDRGRWDLVWAHTMLVGFMLTMVGGTSYHVLSRWTGHPWRSERPIRLHLLAVVLGLPLMLLALATGWTALFKVAGPLQAAAVLLFLATIAPLVLRMQRLSRVPMLAAALCLVVGVSLGAWFAADPVTGARLRMAHAEINLFGWTGLLISGVGYYLVPRLAGRPLRWPRLAWLQITLLGGGIAAGATTLALRGYGHISDPALVVAQVMVASGFALFGTIIAGTFFARRTTRAPIAGMPIGNRSTFIRQKPSA